MIDIDKAYNEILNFTPQELEKYDDQFYGEVIICRNCKYCKDCKRVDNKKVRFAKSPFASYSIDNFIICSDFEPCTNSKYLYKNWTSFEDYYPKHWAISHFSEYKTNWREDFLKRSVPFCINNNYDVNYMVKWADYINGDFIESNILKAYEKSYLKRTKKGFGYKRIIEEINEVEIGDEEFYDKFY